MQIYKADLHIHTVLSPCGDLDMSPRNIVEMAKARNIDIIAITDHNSTLHGPVIRKLAKPLGISVIYGAEVTTREEAHCLCLFDTDAQREKFQEYIDLNLPNIPNDPQRFGYQVVVNENDEILYEIEPLLINGLNVGINDIERTVHALGGLFIPAHIDRPRYSIISQLGFVPPDLKFDALEIFWKTNSSDLLSQHSYLSNPVLIKNSDAHFLDQIGQTFTSYQMAEPTFNELAKALKGEEGRQVLGF
ncbi:MAG: PHP domain-containing protein [Bacteroidales bacterium]|jgi:PHP family Zn ribbon phosphoesterase|nr:PHP domain-containing protein [Bacteroidales bacterium]MDD4383592.1 PHP domain-containing protein [Bacteroidales bacterium]MDY0197335.1 PHP domain-containing protein [Tenuifilaceae bacterium]